MRRFTLNDGKQGKKNERIEKIDEISGDFYYKTGHGY